MSHVHIIDSHVGRRAVLSRFVIDLGSHAEIYESCSEFVDLSPRQGLVLVADSEASALLEAVNDGIIEFTIVVYAEHPKASEIVEAIRGGALDFFEWPTNRERLNRVLRRAEDVGLELQAKLRKKIAAKKLVSFLTARELDVLLGITAGGSNKSIAAELGISSRTVEIHRGHMMRKLKAEAVGDAVRIALYAGLDVGFELAA